jgi:hypothetical protein
LKLLPSNGGRSLNSRRKRQLRDLA